MFWHTSDTLDSVTSAVQTLYTSNVTHDILVGISLGYVGHMALLHRWPNILQKQRFQYNQRLATRLLDNNAPTPWRYDQIAGLHAMYLDLETWAACVPTIPFAVSSR